MQQRMVDRWIEMAEARNVGELAMAEQKLPLEAMPEALPSLMTRLCAMIMQDVGHLRLAFGLSMRPSA